MKFGGKNLSLTPRFNEGVRCHTDPINGFNRLFADSFDVLYVISDFSIFHFFSALSFLSKSVFHPSSIHGTTHSDAHRTRNPAGRL